MSATEGYFVTRTLGALELLADAPRSSTQIAAALGIHVRTARRMLGRLADEGYVHRSSGPWPVYALTPRFSGLAGRAIRQHATVGYDGPARGQLRAASSLLLS